MKSSLLFIALFISVTGYSAVYESDDNGVPEFSDVKTNGAHKLDLTSEPVSVIDADSIPKNIVWGSSTRDNQHYTQNYQNTMQSDFPEQLTDNYYDFYGRNHHYNALMSSTIGQSMYSPNDRNNMRLQRNY